MTDQLHYEIERFSISQGTVWIKGWAVCGSLPISSLSLEIKGAVALKFDLPHRPDPAATEPHSASKVRFDSIVPFSGSSSDAVNATLLIRFIDGSERSLTGLGSSNDPAQHLYLEFLANLQAAPPGHLLEVGSRARSGITRRDTLPSGWCYTGLDVMAGPNVDIVGDAHEISGLFSGKRFDAVMAFSVLEHLLMPWKFAIELNRVLNVGAIGLFTSHQAWPIHDAPWDFWRFSDAAWVGLLNRETGFEIIDARMGEPAFIVANKCYTVTNFGDAPAYGASFVSFRKIAETELTWPVRLVDITRTNYPAGET